MPPRPLARRRRGFSLVEILVVLAIMSLIAGVAAPMVMNQWTLSRQRTALLNAQGFRQATNVWRLRMNNDDCPTPARLIQDKVIDRGAQPRDPWDNEFAIECDDGGVTVRSAGPDRRLGTADDVIAPPETRAASR